MKQLKHVKRLKQRLSLVTCPLPFAFCLFMVVICH